jgi:HSP20 family protein
LITRQIITVFGLVNAVAPSGAMSKNPSESGTQHQETKIISLQTFFSIRRKVMALIKWDPFGSITEIQDRINKIFEEAFPKDKEQNNTSAPPCLWKPAVDIFETDASIVINVELAGVTKEDVSVEMRDNLLTISGERREDHNIPENHYYQRERYFGPFQRSFRLQDAVQPDMIKAKFKEGLLVVEILKTDEEINKQVKISID